MAWDKAKEIGVGFAGLAGSLLISDAYPAMGALAAIGLMEYRLRKTRMPSSQDPKKAIKLMETRDIGRGDFQTQNGSIDFFWHFGS